ncbi:beta-N-acetylglucosaminidase domain-containing protein [Streptomyces sp. NPDC053367]|uniref:beta-N-acetylglucosaminidase domain-containing protein n=1 Tax=Streptomyces sp. NPDC053367 TaxID=3365700 RepID=UPI0037D6F2FF
MRALRVPPALLLGFALGLVLIVFARACADGGGGGTAAAPPGNAAGTTRADDAGPAVPALWPAPRSVRRDHGSVRIGTDVAVQADAGTDPATLDSVVATLRAGGARRVSVGGPPDEGALLVTVVSDGAAEALRPFAVEPPGELEAGGYVLVAGADDGEPRLVLAGVDPAGAFHAAQTLAQLVRPVGAARARGTLPALRIRDWPATPRRGVVEGFYGTPWSHRERLEQLDFAARFKLNTYVYSPKDDTYLRARWREAYPARRLAELGELVGRAEQNHVSFVYALSPGPSVCYSSPSDRAALVRKFRQLWDIGVRSYAVPLDDIDITRWNCAEDASVYGSGEGAVGRAQAELLNAVRRDFLDRRPGAAELITVPTEYDGTRASAYKAAFTGLLDRRTTVMWTGPLVVSPTLRADQAREARRLYGHPLLVWDNYPANDYTADHLLLGPYEGRERGLPAEVEGVTANPMNQAVASDPALFSLAAYTWNPGAYRPAAALDAGLAVLAEGDTEALTALRAFADLNRASRLSTLAAPGLASLTEAYRRGAPGAERALRARLAVLAGLRETLPAAFRDSASPWVACASDWARAAVAALDLRTGGGSAGEVRALRDVARSHTVTDWQGRTRTVVVGEGVLDAFVAGLLR